MWHCRFASALAFVGLLFLLPTAVSPALAQTDYCSSVYKGIFAYEVKCRIQQEDRRRRGEAEPSRKPAPKVEQKTTKPVAKKQAPATAKATKQPPVATSGKPKKDSAQKSKTQKPAKKDVKSDSPVETATPVEPRKDDKDLCDQALTSDRTAWQDSDEARDVVKEAVARGLSIEECRVALGLPAQATDDTPIEIGKAPDAGTRQVKPGDAQSVQQSDQGTPRAIQSNGKRVALVIGNANYANALSLANPANDARAMAASLRQLGFEVVEGEDLDRSKMEAIIRSFVSDLNGASVGLFFYAGHGIQANGKNFLIPVDAKLRDETAIDFETISADQIMGYMTTGQRVAIVLLDACRDNPLAKQLASHDGATRSIRVEEGLAIPAQQQDGGLIIGFATSPGKIAYDGGKANSPFTAGLLKYIPTKGLEIGLMLRKVTRDVIAETNGRQTPWVSAGFGGEFYFNP